MKIVNQKLSYNVGSKLPVSAAEASKYKPHGGNVKIVDQKIKYEVGPKIPTANSANNNTSGSGSSGNGGASDGDAAPAM